MFLLKNNAHSTLMTALTNSATVLSVQVADANFFPQPEAADDYFFLTLEDPLQTPILREIVKCTARSANNITIERAQEGFAASAFNVGVTVSNRITAGTIIALYDTSGYSSQMYLGAFPAAPTETNTGQSLVAGLLYYNTTNNTLYEYEDGWQPIGSGGSALAGGLYIGQYANAPTTRADGTPLENGDLYYNTTSSQLYDYVLNVWAAATATTTVQGNTTVAGNITVDGNITSTGTYYGVDGTVALWDVTQTLTVGSETSAGSFIYNGKPVVDAGDLSGSAGSQNWPNGNIEYWGTGATDGNGSAVITFPDAFPNSITNVQLTVKGAAGSGPSDLLYFDETTLGFSVHSFADGSAYGPVAFSWTAKGN